MIAAALVALAGNPRPEGCVKLAGGQALWRIRVRQYRVIYQILDDQLKGTLNAAVKEFAATFAASKATAA